MPRKNVNEHATKESRAKGARAKAESLRRKREEREAVAEQKLGTLADKALARLECLLDAEDESVQVRAAKEVLDRYFGRPSQRHEHSGADGGAIAVELTQVRERFNTRIADRASRK